MALDHSRLPPLDWTISLPEILVFHEKTNADVPLYVLADPTSDVSQQVTYGQLVRACRRIPRLLGLTDDDVAAKPVVAIVANTDTLIYHTIMLGLILAGVIPFPISHRNTAEAVLHLIRTTSAKKLIMTSNTLPKLADEVTKGLAASDPEWSQRIIEPPVISQLYPELTQEGQIHGSIIDDDYTGPTTTLKPDINSPCIFIHSSGSTGLPKAIPMTHHSVIKYMRYPACFQFRQAKKRIQLACMELPPFHGMAVCFQLFVPLFHGSSTCLLYPNVRTPNDVPPTMDPDIVIEYIHRTKANACFTVPAFLQAWVHNKRHLEILKKLEFINYGGGALSPVVGEILHNEGVPLRLVYGGSEFGPSAMQSLRPGDENEWEYLEFSEDAYPHFVDQGDGTYELQFISPPEYPMAVTNIPGVNGYATSDLVRPHPTKKHLWKLVGRIDDVIVHSSGEKTVPGPIESVIQSSPYVNGVVVFGVSRMQPGVLIELSKEHAVDVGDPKQVATLRDEIWPTVEAANKVAPAFSRIFKEMILFTSREKPLPRTPKMTIIKKAAWALYEREINNVYENASNVFMGNSRPETWTEGALSQWLLAQVDELGFKDIKPSENLFDHGFDSLCATVLRQRILNAVESITDVKNVVKQAAKAFNLIYAHPTITNLASYLTTITTDSTASMTNNHVAAMERMITKYRFPAQTGGKEGYEDVVRKPRVVLITGSTGGLGSHVLQNLLRDPSLAKVYTLNRSDSRSDISERHQRRFQDRGLDEKLLASTNLVHLESDAADANLGLDESVYEELKSSVDLIIHIAWKMDFNQSLESFESNVQAARNLAQLARSSTRPGQVRFIFTSSVGVAKSWDHSQGAYPEKLVSDARCAVGSGYGEAKYVSEMILASSGLDVVSVRIGQITGSEANGAWSTSDWVPIIFESSIALKELPTTRGNVSWLSADAVAATILDIARYDKRLPEAVNVIHPRPMTWDTMVRHIQSALQAKCGILLPVTEYQKWFADLLSTSSDSKNASRIPAIKLIEFFNHLAQGDRQDSATRTSESFSQPIFITQTCQSVSKTLADLPSLSQDDIYKWVRYWAEKGLFSRGPQQAIQATSP